jgi:hypothetical protein
MKVGRLKRRALTSYFLTSGYRRGLVLLTSKKIVGIPLAGILALGTRKGCPYRINHALPASYR